MEYSPFDFPRGLFPQYLSAQRDTDQSPSTNTIQEAKSRSQLQDASCQTGHHGYCSANKENSIKGSNDTY